MLEQYADTWLGGLKRECTDWRFHRGLVDITMKAFRFKTRRFGKVAPALFAHAGVQRVRLEIPGRLVHAVAGSPHLEHVAQLELSGGRLEQDHLDTLLASDYLQRLTHLDLSSNNLGDAALDALTAASLPSLVWLGLRNNQIEGSGLDRLLSSPLGQRLRWLDLHGNP